MQENIIVYKYAQAFEGRSDNAWYGSRKDNWSKNKRRESVNTKKTVYVKHLVEKIKQR